MSKPVLYLGTIVSIKDGENEKMLLCIQPRCDSFRLENDVFFPFIPMEEIKKDDINFDLVIEKEENVFLKFKFESNSNNCDK